MAVRVEVCRVSRQMALLGCCFLLCKGIMKMARYIPGVTWLHAVLPKKGEQVLKSNGLSLVSQLVVINNIGSTFS